MSRTYEIIRGAILLLGILGLTGWLMARWLKRSEDAPGRLVAKWVISLVLLGVFFGVVGPLVRQGGFVAAFVGVPAAAVVGLIMAILWVPNITAYFARPFTALYDGGEEEIEPRPLYSVAETRRKQGKYREAAAEVRLQLERFPHDPDGHFLLAEIQAENLLDMAGATLTLQRFCNDREAEPRYVAYAMHRLADWHLRLEQDAEAARQALETLIERFPGSTIASQAAQRIAHLGDREMLLSPHDRQSVEVAKGIENIGLLRESPKLAPAETGPEERAGELINHLEIHPLDAAAREELAVLYAGHYQRLDLAGEQIEHLPRQPNQAVKSIVHWLNLLADLHVKHSGELGPARRALERIVELFPDLPAAENARRRMDTLRLEFKGKEKSQAVKLGSYEQNIGLKGRRSA